MRFDKEDSVDSPTTKTSALQQNPTAHMKLTNRPSQSLRKKDINVLRLNNKEHLGFVRMA